MKISIVIPVYGGAGTIEALVAEVKRELKGQRLEIILINDCSPDNSEEVCERMARADRVVKFISLRKNSGEHNAVMCGLNFVTGDYVAIIDDDFQNPPSEIMKLVQEAEKGYDVVFSKYHKKKHHWFRNLGSWFNDRVASWLMDKPKNLYLSSFKVIKKELVKEIIQYRGPFPYIDGLILRATRNYSSVYVDHVAREEGKSSYTLGKLFSLWLNMFINFSIKPLRVFTLFGIVTAVSGFGMAVYFVIEKILYPATQVGWTSLVVILLIFSGLQLMFLGLVGEYIGKLYLDVNKTPQWVIRKKIL